MLVKLNSLHPQPPRRLVSLLLINKLSTGLQVEFETAEKWILMLENLYICLRIFPWTDISLRLLKKEKSTYGIGLLT
jgi:predicted AAA+ superfamily ATPase